MRVVAIPMRVRFRGVTVREAALFEGPSGWAEFSPFLEYGTAGVRALAGAPPSRPAGAGGRTRGATASPSTRRSRPCRPTDVAGVLARFDGATTAKVKVAERGQSLQDDLDRVAAVRDVMGPEGRIRVDANGGWSVREATDALRRLAAYRLEYAEQPCAEVSELRELRLALARARHRRAGGRRRVDPQGRGPGRGWRARRPPTWSSSRSRRSVGCPAPWRSWPSAGCPRWSRRRSTRRWGWRPGSRWRRPCPSCRSPAGWGTVALLDGDVTAAPLLPRAGALPVGRVGGRRGPARSGGRRRWTGSRGGPRGCGTAGRSWPDRAGLLAATAPDPRAPRTEPPAWLESGP